jgi:UDP-N-acetylglucosamine--N-acetylmuramyl-(pentapeptide) pyrophosphoryl-undecaprenol N-acetylglucosamine transferase
MHKLKVLIAAGGSGGHLFPAQQLAAMLSADCEIAFAGHKLRASPFFAAGIPFWEIASAQPKRGSWLKFMAASWRGFWQSVSLLRKYRPDVVIGFGSYHSFPALLAAMVLRKKLVLFEANCILGKVNRLFLPAAKKIALQFPLEKKLAKEVFVPYLPWTGAPKKRVSKKVARAYFGLDPDRLTLLVFGGSQGAAFLNQMLPEALSLLKGEFQVIHLTGKGNTTVSYGKVPACVKEFEAQMDFAYAASDIAICRSGAGTVAELIRAALPALLIPFPHAAENHQWKNGQFLSTRVRGARLLAQRKATPEKIAAEIEQLLLEREQCKASLHAWRQQETTDFAALVREVGASA